MRREFSSTSKIAREVRINKDEAIIMSKALMPWPIGMIKPGNHNWQAMGQHGSDGATFAEKMGRCGGHTKIGLLEMTRDLQRWEGSKLPKGDARRSGAGEVTPQGLSMFAGKAHGKEFNRLDLQMVKDR